MKTGKSEKTKKKRQLRIHEVTHENDLRYRGPLSYQHFQILGWLCIIIAQAAVLLKLGSRLDQQLATDLSGVLQILTGIADFSLPFLLIANFARILTASEGCRNQLFKNIGAAAGIAGLFYVFFYRYLVGLVQAVFKDPAEALPAAESVLSGVFQYGFLSFNIFVDLLLCTLVMLFLNYTPTRVFKGKSVIIFRLFALLPIGYEVGCMILKIRSARGIAPIPIWAWPLLPVKPAMTFVLFILLALFVKTRELRFRRHGKTHEEYQAFLKTKRNSWNFSVFLAVMMVIVSLIDFLIVIGFSLNEGMPLLMEGVNGSQPAVEQTAGETAAADLPADEIAAAMQTAEQTVNEATVAALTEEQTTEAEQIEESGQAARSKGISDEAEKAIEKGMLTALAVGFGGSISLALLSPIVLLFSYTRVPKNKKIGMMIPAAAIVIIFVLYLEGIHGALFRLPIQKLSLKEINDFAAQLIPLFQ